MYHTVSPLRGPGSIPCDGVFSEIFLTDHAPCLVHSLGRLKARPTAETVAESGVAPPSGEWRPLVKNCFQFQKMDPTSDRQEKFQRTKMVYGEMKGSHVKDNDDQIMISFR